MFLQGCGDILTADIQDIIKMEACADAATGHFLGPQNFTGFRATVFPDIAVQHHDKTMAISLIDNIAHHRNPVLKIGGQDGDIFYVFSPEP